MTTDEDVDRQIQAYLESGPAELADRVLWAARAQLKTTRRRRARFAGLAPLRIPTLTTPIRLATTAVIGLIVVGGGLYLIQPGRSAVGGPSPAPTQTLATSSVSGGRTGVAHYEITGPDAASGDVKFASSATSGVSSAGWGQSVLFQEGPLFIRINFPAHANCVFGGGGGCGAVSFSTATLYVVDAGWRAVPLPGAPSCTWDTANVTVNGGTGSVECINAVNPTHPTTPDSITIAFTYHDASPVQLQAP